MKKITIVDVAKKCNVGVSTVSRALNNNSDINEDTKKKILKVIDELGYVPNNSARNLKRTDAKCIGVLIKGITNPMFAPMTEIIEQKISRSGYATVVRYIRDDENESDIAAELAMEKRLCALIFLGGSFENEGDKLKKIGIPIVFSTVSNIDDSYKKSYSLLSVDDEKESFKIVNYLIKLGHKNIAIITEGTGKPSVALKREKGYKRALKENGIKENKDNIYYVDDKIEHFSMQNGYETARKIFANRKDITAIFCVSDYLAIGAVRAAKDAGIIIPKDVSIVGFDGIDIGRYMVPSLTTIMQPSNKIAHDSIDLLFDIIEKKKQNEIKIYDAKIIKGESAGVPRRKNGT